MNIQKNINNLLQALTLKENYYRINSFKFYSEKNNSYCTKYQILKKIFEEQYNVEKDEFEVVERYVIDYECYSKVDILKYLVEEYKQGSEANE